MKRRTTKAPGFSLLELMLVIALIGVLTGIVAFSMAGAGERAKRRATITSLGVIKAALQSYQLAESAFPPDLNTLITTKYLDPDKKLKDGWETDFFYSPAGSEGKPFILLSLGPDKTGGTADDIDYTVQK